MKNLTPAERVSPLGGGVLVRGLRSFCQGIKNA